MKPPQEYIDLLETFAGMDTRAVRIDEVNRDDYICLKMAAFCLNMPIDVQNVKGTQKGLFLIRKVLSE